MSLTNRVDKKTLLQYAAEICLALSLTYAVYYLASLLGLQYFVLLDRGMVKQTVAGPILSGPLDVLVWGVAVFVVLAWLIRYFGLNDLRRNPRSFSNLGILALLGVAGAGVSLAVLGFVGVWSLVLVSGLLLGLCLAFASGLFGVSRVGLLLRVMFFGFLLVLVAELTSTLRMWLTQL